MLKLLTCYLTLLSIAHAQQVEIYGQCGGLLWQGSTQCAAGLTCQYQNEWYSQCLPGTNPTDSSTSAPTKPTIPPGPVSTNGYFTAKNGKLYDANGKEFLIRGVNSAHLWFDNWNRNYALKSLVSMDRANVNLVRIVWGLNPDGGLNRDSLENIIKTTIDLKMIPMVELHDATGSSDVNRLVECATWFKNNIDLFNKYQKYILINIANEWSPWGTSLEVWRDAWNKAIAVVRSSGWGGAIVVDASAYAQNPDGPIKYGKEMVEADPSKNLIFSVHMYSQWKKNNGDYKIEQKLTELQSQGLTVVIGEFASTHPEGCNWIEIDVYEIMRQCKARSIGYIGWSWHGNGQGDCNSDLAPLNIIRGSSSVEATWLSNDYTEWGNALINYSGYGIKDTSLRASYF